VELHPHDIGRHGRKWSVEILAARSFELKHEIRSRRVGTTLAWRGLVDGSCDLLPYMMAGAGMWGGYGPDMMRGYGPGVAGPGWNTRWRDLNLSTENVKNYFDRSRGKAIRI
jgi:hypothetical protein